jgi:pyridoxamine 5'-phosphate oxidase family protein
MDRMSFPSVIGSTPMERSTAARELSTSRKFHNVEARPRAAFVVDDTVREESGPFRAGIGRGIEVRGRAEALVGVEPTGLGGDIFSDEVIRIYPDQIVSCGGTNR